MLPEAIASLESEQKTLESRAATAGFYRESREAIQAVLQRIDAIAQELEAAYRRWDELDSVK